MGLSLDNSIEILFFSMLYSLSKRNWVRFHFVLLDVICYHWGEKVQSTNKWSIYFIFRRIEFLENLSFDYRLEVVKRKTKGRKKWQRGGYRKKNLQSLVEGDG